ncbi:MAG: HAMP domain-containing histidine kinase [Thermosynechococcaceae cyanobacterium MS004]|nr:HAMP domain-containing histidine kinase [Thermosynechococcaceae cyanobacterium MS004]
MQQRQPLSLNWKWFRLFGEARTRILIWYVGVIVLFIAIAIPVIRHLIFERVEDRVKGDLNEEIENFRELLTDGPIYADEPTVQKLQRDGGAIPNGYPSNRKELSSLYEIYLSRQIPEDDTFLIAFLDGNLYKSSPRALPPLLDQSSELMQRWGNLERSQQGTQETQDFEVGTILYSAESIRLNGKTLGTFVVIHTTAGEQNEALEAFHVVVLVMVVGLALALAFIWLAASRVLAPLRSLSATAHSITESDLSRRIPAEGKGEIAELAQTFNEMMDRLQESFESQRDFVHDAGHELRTPITIIRGHLELMGNDPVEQQETVALVLDELDRMSRMVSELSLLVKADRPDFLQPEQVDIETFMQELYTKATALSLDRDWYLEAAATGQFMPDRQRLTEAVMNLAENAVQHTEAGDRITLGADLKQNTLRLWVRDTGTGVAPEDQQRIFARFARAAKQRRRSEGTGLGLAIVKAIAEAHHGQVTLESKLGTGSTFTLVLPLSPTDSLSLKATAP